MFDSHLTEKADITKLFKKYNEIKKKKKRSQKVSPGRDWSAKEVMKRSFPER